MTAFAVECATAVWMPTPLAGCQRTGALAVPHALSIFFALRAAEEFARGQRVPERLADAYDRQWRHSRIRARIGASL